MKHSIQLARIALHLDTLIAEIIEQPLDQVDADLLTPARTHLRLATDQLDAAILEVEQHGRSYPHGKPRLRLASDPEERIAA